jgi:DNA-binding NarL/FixJ family response regulator
MDEMKDGASSPARMLIAEDHALVRQGIRGMLASEPDFDVIGEAESGREAIKLCRELVPDLVLMDVRMPEMDGLEATRAIKGEFPTTSVLIVTSNENPDYLLDAIRAGAAGYVLKEATRDELIESVRRVLNGEPTLDQGLAMGLLKRVANETNGQAETSGKRHKPSLKPPAELLSGQEIEVLRLLALGKTNRQIGQTLNVSLSSVKTYLKRIMEKLKVSDRTQAAVRAVELGLLPDQEER